MKNIETQLHEAHELLKAKDAEIVTLKRVIHQKQIAHANVQRDWQLKEAGLLPDSITRLHAAFATSTDNAGLKEAINVERKRYGSISKAA